MVIVIERLMKNWLLCTWRHTQLPLGAKVWHSIVIVVVAISLIIPIPWPEDEEKYDSSKYNRNDNYYGHNVEE